MLHRKIFNRYTAAANNVINQLVNKYGFNLERFGVDNEYRSVSVSGSDKNEFLALTLGGKKLNLTINNRFYQVVFDRIEGVKFLRASKSTGFKPMQKKQFDKDFNKLVTLLYASVTNDKAPTIVVKTK